jgi:hypothetical protein
LASVSSARRLPSTLGFAVPKVTHIWESQVIIPKPKVLFLRPVSDIQLRLLLGSIAELLGRDLRVHSGDRDYRPKGSPRRSLHLAHRAADLHVNGMTDDQAFRLLLALRTKLPTNDIHRYQLIHHGQFTETEAEHIHIGDYPLITGLALGPGVTCLVEGMTPQTKGKYSRAA